MRLDRAFWLAVLLLPAAAVAQTSQKPIRIIVPFAPGASADGIARAIGGDLGTRMGKPVIIENNVGAGGALGLTAVAKSPPDGDTLGVGATGALLINRTCRIPPRRICVSCAGRQADRGGRRHRGNPRSARNRSGR